MSKNNLSLKTPKNCVQNYKFKQEIRKIFKKSMQCRSRGQPWKRTTLNKKIMFEIIIVAIMKLSLFNFIGS
jgi:hypothetical protein